jgi:hypothetical protein
MSSSENIHSHAQVQLQQDLLLHIGNQNKFISEITDTQKLQAKKLMQVSSLVERQQEHLRIRDIQINQLADTVINLQHQITTLQKLQKEDSIVMQKKIDTKKCIELNTHIGRSQQQQIENQQKVVHTITSHLSKLDSIQKENSTLILNKMDTERCMTIINTTANNCQTRLQEQKTEIKNSILKDASFKEEYSSKNSHVPTKEKEYKRSSLDDTSILIGNIKSNQNSKLITQNFFKQFQISQDFLICSNSQWTRQGKLRIKLKNQSSADWLRKIISYKMKTKLFLNGYVSSMFQHCYIIHKFNPKTQHDEGGKLKQGGDYMNQQTTVLRRSGMNNYQDMTLENQKPLKNKR